MGVYAPAVGLPSDPLTISWIERGLAFEALYSKSAFRSGPPELELSVRNEHVQTLAKSLRGC